MKKMTIPTLIIALALAAVAPSAFAIKSCAECTFNDPCNLVCYVNDGGRTVYHVCDEFACSGWMMQTPLEEDILGTEQLEQDAAPSIPVECAD
jgi:hypothetical protein